MAYSHLGLLGAVFLVFAACSSSSSGTGPAAGEAGAGGAESEPAAGGAGAAARGGSMQVDSAGGPASAGGAAGAAEVTGGSGEGGVTALASGGADTKGSGAGSGPTAGDGVTFSAPVANVTFMPATPATFPQGTTPERAQISWSSGGVQLVIKFNKSGTTEDISINVYGPLANSNSALDNGSSLGGGCFVTGTDTPSCASFGIDFSLPDGRVKFDSTPMKTGLNIGNQAPATFTMSGELRFMPF